MESRFGLTSDLEEFLWELRDAARLGPGNEESVLSVLAGLMPRGRSLLPLAHFPPQYHPQVTMIIQSRAFHSVVAWVLNQSLLALRGLRASRARGQRGADLEGQACRLYLALVAAFIFPQGRDRAGYWLRGLAEALGAPEEKLPSFVKADGSLSPPVKHALDAGLGNLLSRSARETRLAKLAGALRAFGFVQTLEAVDTHNRVSLTCTWVYQPTRSRFQTNYRHRLFGKVVTDNLERVDAWLPVGPSNLTVSQDISRPLLDPVPLELEDRGGRWWSRGTLPFDPPYAHGNVFATEARWSYAHPAAAKDPAGELWHDAYLVSDDEIGRNTANLRLKVHLPPWFPLRPPEVMPRHFLLWLPPDFATDEVGRLDLSDLNDIDVSESKDHITTSIRGSFAFSKMRNEERITLDFAVSNPPPGWYALAWRAVGCDELLEAYEHWDVGPAAGPA